MKMIFHGVLALCFVFCACSFSPPAHAQVQSLRHAHNILWTIFDDGNARSNILSIPSEYSGSGCESAFTTRIPFVTRQTQTVRWGRIRGVYDETNPLLGNGPHVSLSGSMMFDEDGVREHRSSLVIFFNRGDTRSRDRVFEAARYLKRQCAPY